MRRLIDANALRNALYDADAITMKGVAIINQFPTVDAVEVVHGKWNFDDECWAYNCSNCRTSSGVSRLFNYCPNCGAKMDGDVNG